jgi:type II secretory pathway pseudopilin PulG
LIELLIVIAIILILIAIALPNFLEAQMRAKITTAGAEMRGLAVAMESYRTDWNRYPPQSFYELTASGFCFRANRCSLRQLTTPIPYLLEIPRDIFSPDPHTPVLDNSGRRYPWASLIDERDGHAYFYWSQESIRKDNERCADTLKQAGVNYVLLSLGPDRDADARTYEDNCTTMVGSRTGDVAWIYNATNGTKSNGDIHRYRP